jgi:hypothetical protein
VTRVKSRITRLESRLRKVTPAPANILAPPLRVMPIKQIQTASPRIQRLLRAPNQYPIAR